MKSFKHLKKFIKLNKNLHRCLPVYAFLYGFSKTPENYLFLIFTYTKALRAEFYGSKVNNLPKVGERDREPPAEIGLLLETTCGVCKLIHFNASTPRGQWRQQVRAWRHWWDDPRWCECSGRRGRDVLFFPKKEKGNYLRREGNYLLGLGVGVVVGLIIVSRILVCVSLLSVLFCLRMRMRSCRPDNDE